MLTCRQHRSGSRAVRHHPFFFVSLAFSFFMTTNTETFSFLQIKEIMLMKSCAWVVIPTKPNRKVLPRHIISVLYFKRHAQDSPSQRLGPSRDENDLIVCTLFVFATDSSLKVGVIILHLALCESNERERALGPGVGEDQEASVCVFPLTASGARIDVEAMGYVTPVRRRETPPTDPSQPAAADHWLTGSHDLLYV